MARPHPSPSFHGGLYGMHAGERCFCNVEFDGVEVIGQAELHPDNSPENYNVGRTFAIGGWQTDWDMIPEENKLSFNVFFQRMTGEIKVKKCGMKTFSYSGILTGGLDDSKIKVEDCEAENGDRYAVVIDGYPSNCKIEVSKLKTEGPSVVSTLK